MHRIWFRLRCWWYGYDSDFVDSVLAADRLKSEVGFDNVNDLLKYLNED